MKQQNGIYSAQRDEVSEIGTNYIGWSESGKAILNETLVL